MSGLLSYCQLKNLLRDGVVVGSEEQYVNGASIDVRLGAKLLVEAPPYCISVDTTPQTEQDRAARIALPITVSIEDPRKPIVLRDREPIPMNEYTMTEDGFVIHPGQFILAHTLESFNLPNTLAADFKLKSSAARIGLEQLSAGWCDPGWHGSTLTMELVNCTRYTPIRLHTGDLIGQMVFYRCAPVPAEKSYSKRGRYNNAATVEGIKP